MQRKLNSRLVYDFCAAFLSSYLQGALSSAAVSAAQLKRHLKWLSVYTTV